MIPSPLAYVCHHFLVAILSLSHTSFILSYYYSAYGFSLSFGFKKSYYLNMKKKIVLTSENSEMVRELEKWLNRPLWVSLLLSRLDRVKKFIFRLIY